MFFDFSVTIPFSTSKAKWQEMDLKLSAGIVHHVEILFPWGPAGLVYVTLWHMEHQVWPLNPGGAFNSDEETVKWDDHYEIEEPYNWLRARCWNLDDTFDHTVELRFGILPPEQVAVASLLSGFIDLMKEVFRI